MRNRVRLGVRAVACAALRLVRSSSYGAPRNPTAKTRSVFIWHTADNVLEGWQSPLERLFRKKEFAFGLRYVVYYGNPDKYTKQAYYRFAEAPDKILRHFSEGRLCSLVRNIQTH